MTIKKNLYRCLVFILALYSLVLIWFYQQQAQLIFSPDPHIPQAKNYGHGLPQTLRWNLPDNSHILSWYWPVKYKGQPTFFMLHGQTGTLEDRAENWQALIAKGYGVLMVGYAHNSGGGGETSETVVNQNALNVLKQFSEKYGIQKTQIIAYGQSLGTGTALFLGQQIPELKAIILESPYDQLAIVGQKRYPYIPVKWLMTDNFNSMERLSQIKAPVLIGHGSSDMTIPLQHAKNLFSYNQNPKSKLEIFDGAQHNNLYEFNFVETIERFVDKQKNL